MKKYGIVVSEFNSEFTEKMLVECLKGFREQKIKVEVCRVPGAVEIPIACQEMILEKKVTAIVALGLVLKGETDHYEQVCNICSQGILKVSLKYHIPIIFEVLMLDKYKKAEKRIKKAYEAAYLATKMSQIIKHKLK